VGQKRVTSHLELGLVARPVSFDFKLAENPKLLRVPGGANDLLARSKGY
jgi:hypothetical protein